MSLPVLELNYQEQIYSPFSGLPAHSEDGPNEKDPTLLFVHVGTVNEFGYISPRMKSLVEENIEDISLENLIEQLSVENGIILKVNRFWNGIDSYCFAPVKQD